MQATTRLVALAALAACLVPRPARATERTLTLDPKTTSIAFTLGAVLHTAEGRIALASGEIRWDDATGAASGEIVVDAKSADTDNDTRDANMHRDVLESGKHPRIVFRPAKLAVLRREGPNAEVELAGELELHGAKLPLVLPAKLVYGPAGSLAIESAFRVDYVNWGVPDYSTFILRVDRFVDVTVKAEGRLSPP